LVKRPCDLSGWQSLVGKFQPNTIGAELAELAENT